VWQRTEQALDEGDETDADFRGFIPRELSLELITQDFAEIFNGFVAQGHAAISIESTQHRGRRRKLAEETTFSSPCEELLDEQGRVQRQFRVSAVTALFLSTSRPHRRGDVV